MANNNTPLEQLKAFLNQLFQFDSQDLDFGVYKILHYKKKEIANFIDQLLVEKVKEQLQTLSTDESKQIKEQIADLEKDDIIKGWLEAEVDEKKTLEKFGRDKINQYKELTAKASEATVSVETENQIYNHLTLFFSRYYDKGDFISKRRFGKNEKYMVPYNGEETHFHWANHDQYYIKSSETFNHYAFKVQTYNGTLIVNFKLHNAQLEQGNVKADEPNFFLLADKAPEIKEKDDSELSFILANKQPDVSEKEITIYFEYRPLADDEKKKVKGNSKQDNLDEIAFEYLKKEFSTNPLFANLWKEQEGKPLLLKKLQHYTRKNKHDFFIHKNLKSFLERELDYYIKSELVNVDDLYVTDSDTHFDRLKHNLKTIKVFKSIADTIIAFVSQIEDFQKKLWEKKKFVLSTEWVITIDRLVEYIGEEAAKPILEEVIKNEKQVAEWKELFGEKALPKNKDDFKADLHTWRKLPIDTVNFSIAFKDKLLSKISESKSLSEVSDGFAIRSDNFHALTSLRTAYEEKIGLIYIDPPYNTGKDGFIYKDGFNHSTWSSFFQQTASLSKHFLKNSGLKCVSISDIELINLKQLLDSSYGSNNFIANLIWNNEGNIDNQKRIKVNHEYILSYAKENKSFESPKVIAPDIDSSKSKLFNEKIENTITKNGPKNPKSEIILPKGFPCTVDSKEYVIRTDKWPHIRKNFTVKDGVTAQESLFYSGWSSLNLLKKFIENECKPILDANGLTTSFKITESGAIYVYKERKDSSHVLSIVRNVGNVQKTSSFLSDMGFKFSYPKPIDLIKYIIQFENDDNSIVLDYFAGSGTTFQSLQELKREYKGCHKKVIIVDQGQYFNDLIIPRIKKIAYTFDWKDGKPKDGSMNGLGVFFKYQRLEQYEEALENIAFNASEDAVQLALQLDSYIPKYFLEFETKGSQTLVNTAAMQDPWDYKLKVWDGFTYDTEQAVDLVETFNYLIGLHMQKCITKEINGKKYQFIYGHNNSNKNILVVWRSVKDWTLEDYKADAAALKEELKVFAYDLLYINDQAHIEDYQPIEEVFRNKMLS